MSIFIWVSSFQDFVKDTSQKVERSLPVNAAAHSPQVKQLLQPLLETGDVQKQVLEA